MIQMADMSNENLRRFPHYGDRRNSGTNPEEAGEFQLPLDYADNIPLEVDIRMDTSQHMNALAVRSYNPLDLNGTNRRPTLHGTSLNREEVEQYQNDGLRSRGDDPALLDGKLPGFMPNALRMMAQVSTTTTHGNTTLSAEQRALLAYWGMASLPAALSNGGGNTTPDNNGTWLLGHPSTGMPGGNEGLGSFGVHASLARRWRGDSGLIPAKNLIQLLLTGSVNISSFEIADVLSFVMSDMGAGANGHPFAMLTPNTVPFDASALAGTEGVQKTLDTMALSMVYSSFLDFVVDWRDHIENLCLNLRYLKGEFIGFFERGFKSHFWQRFGTGELYILCWAVQLGMAVRRGRWQNNLHRLVQTNSAGATMDEMGVFGGVFHPFMLKLDDLDYSQGRRVAGETTEWCTPGLLRYLDEMNYECGAYDEPERGIYVEDLLTGLDIIMDEASREAGMGWRSIGRGYMEFFEDFKTASIVDVRSTESRTNPAALRVAEHLGFNTVEPISRSNGTNGNAHVSWWSSFVTRGGIIDVDRKGRLIEDINDLSNLSFLTGSKFTAGMQMNGLSKGKVFHRKDTNGNEHSIDLTLDLECKMSLVNFELAFPGTDANSTVTMAHAHWPEVPSFPTRPRIVVCWPSSGQGYHVYKNSAYHPLAHIKPGSWDTLDIDGGIGRGYSHVCMPDGTLPLLNRYNSGGNTPATMEVLNADGDVLTVMPMFGEMYYDISPGGWFPALMKSLSTTYERWQDGQTQSPWKSNWTGSSVDGINLVSMLSMSTGEALLQSNLTQLLYGGYCGGSGGSPWRLELRHIDRRLHDETIHVKPYRYQVEEVGMDAVALMLPEGTDASRYMESQLMLNVLGALQNRLQGPHGGSPSPDPSYYSVGANSFGSHYDNHLEFISEVGMESSDAWGNNLRVVFMNEQLLNGEIVDYSITRTMPIVPNAAGQALHNGDPFAVSWNSAVIQPHDAQAFGEGFNFWTERVLSPGSVGNNAASAVPGMRQFFGTFFTLDPEAPSSFANSPCSIFGQSTDWTNAGSRIPALQGRAAQPIEVTSVVQAMRTHMNTPERQPFTPAVLATLTRWDTELWMEYVAGRRGVEYGGSASARALQVHTYLYNQTEFSVLMLDQDFYDTFNQLRAVNLFLNQRQVSVTSTAHAVLSKNGDVSYSGMVNTIGSGGGVATGSTFDESDVQSSATTETYES
jgi:hypothetical protein